MKWKRGHDQFGRLIYEDLKGQFRITRLATGSGGYILDSPRPDKNRSFAFLRDAKAAAEQREAKNG